MAVAAQSHVDEDRRVAAFVERVNAARDEEAARDADRERFARLRSQLRVHPASAAR
jgi:hypothetical protein